MSSSPAEDTSFTEGSMNLNHLNLIVADLQAAVDLFVNLFDFSLDRSGGNKLAVLSNRHGFTLVLMSVDGAAPIYPDGFHIGFILESPDQVDALHTRATQYGITVDQQPARRHGNYGFYFTALNGLLFEVTS
jgi:catechol 2,3-dioxygenase-like lactoylglutathione lyase family enzyme